MTYWFKPNGHWNSITEEVHEFLRLHGYEWDRLQYRCNDA